MNNKVPHVAFLSLLLASALSLPLLALTGCSDGAAKEGRPARPPVAVITAPVEQQTVPVRIEEIGTVSAYQTVDVRAKIGGQLTAAHFQEGDEVRKGQLLFEIDSRPFQASLNQAKADLAKDRAQLEKAVKTERRMSDMLGQKVISQEEYDQAHAEAQALQGTIQADEARIEQANVNLAYSTIYSPIDGRTGGLMIHVGNLIKADDSNPLVTINQVTPIHVSFSVPEKSLPEIRRRMSEQELVVEATLPDDETNPSTGTLTFLDNAVNPDTGTIILKALFPNEDRRLWPGQFVNVRLQLAWRPNAVLAPTEAIQTGQSGQYVFVIGADSTAQIRPVQIGEPFGAMTIIEKGLEPGEQVVTDGQMRLTPGAKVEIRTDLDPAANKEAVAQSGASNPASSQATKAPEKERKP